MRTLEQYLALITSEHRGRPKFEASLRTAVEPLADLQAFLESVPGDFDLDVAIGVQLDVVGLWVGVSRRIPQPLPNIWFAFDRVGVGFDHGYWKGPYDLGTLLDRLDDDTYRRLIRAKIMVNNGDGTIVAAQAVMDEFFTDPQTFIMVEDNAFAVTNRTWFAFDDSSRGFETGQWFVPGQHSAILDTVDMRMTIGVAGKIPSIVDLEILNQEVLPVPPGAVELDIFVVSIDRTPLFGFDVENQYVSGFEASSWGVTPGEMVDALV